jgi:hypothetical protein
MIRTSGEFRISNFLLYQLAYAELYFTEYTLARFQERKTYTKPYVDFQQRERRFGKTGDQLKGTTEAQHKLNLVLTDNTDNNCELRFLLLRSNGKCLSFNK